MLSFLPDFILKSLSDYNLKDICEIRLRQNSPIFIFTQKKWIKIQLNNDRIVTKNDLENVVLRLTNHSIYAHMDTIKQGYISTNFGVRVGICGQVVKESEDVKIIKNISSLCVRLPKEVKGFGQVVYNNVFLNGLKNFLIISPPGFGKTTLLRDLIQLLSNNYNVLCVDEKGELFAENTFSLGDRTDILQYATKGYGLSVGVKNMSPDVICVDELSTENDVYSCINACFSGVKVVATIHGSNIEDVLKKPTFKPLISSGAFENYCELSRFACVTKIGKI